MNITVKYDPYHIQTQELEMEQGMWANCYKHLIKYNTFINPSWSFTRMKCKFSEIRSNYYYKYDVVLLDKTFQEYCSLCTALQTRSDDSTSSTNNQNCNASVQNKIVWTRFLSIFLSLSTTSYTLHVNTHYYVTIHSQK